MRKEKFTEDHELANWESNLPKDYRTLALLNEASYISERSLGTIDVFGALQRVYEQGKNDALKSL